MVRITEVEAHSRAARAGILPNDVLVAINGNEIFDVLDYRFYLAEQQLSLSLLRDNAPYGAQVTLNAANGWTYEWTNLPVYNANGTGKSVYSLDEAIVDKYTSSADYESVELNGEAEDKITITNSYTPESVAVEAEKVWQDNENEYGMRPTSVRLTLKAKVNGHDVEIAPVFIFRLICS